MGDRKPLETYITCQALGTAILLTKPTDSAKKILPNELKDKEPIRSVVLIDEIDKAPRDLPNDVLNEIEAMKFTIKEADWEPFAADPRFCPIVVLTSNSEKNLPDAFLRRCVFYHIEFPNAETLKQIVVRRFGKDGYKPEIDDEFLNSAIGHFRAIRNLNLKKQPATAEFLAWISILRAMGVSSFGDQFKAKIGQSYSVLAKTREDLAIMKSRV
jgi:MoxR-like ATPase